MANDYFMGGFIGTTGNQIEINKSSFSSGNYETGDIVKLKQANSWPGWDSSPAGVGTYITRSTSSSGTIYVPSGTEYVFVSLSAGGGSGAHDNDCRNQTPGGDGGVAKALVYLPNVGTSVTSITYSLGAGGPGVGGNDASGASGSGSNITIGNFSLTCNGGGGGFNYTNSGTGPPGNSSVSGPYTLYSTSSVFASSVVDRKTAAPATYTYLSMPTSSPGSGARCGEGGSSSPGSEGFLYIRYGGGINASTTLTPGQDPPITGPTQAYTAFY